MSEEPDRTSGATSTSTAAEGSKGQSPSAKATLPKRIYLVPYPKIILLYPILIAAVCAAVGMKVFGGAAGPEPSRSGVLIAEIFLAVVTMNLVILAFDFPRATSLTLFFLIAALVLGSILLVTFKPEVLPFVKDLFARLHPVANATFYGIVASMMIVIYIAVFISVRFDYWEIRPNELLHHHGFLSDLERLSAPHLRIEKEINDVFEYLLLRSGRLILHPSDDRRSIVLENVPFIDRKEEDITRMLSALQVQIRQDN